MVPTLWLFLAQFVFRVSFGLAVALGVTPAKLVTSGLYRVHLWVIMGLNTFAALGIQATHPQAFPRRRFVLALAVALAVGSFVGLSRFTLAFRVPGGPDPSLDGLANAQSPQYAERNRHPLCRRDPGVPRGIDVEATVRGPAISFMISL